MHGWIPAWILIAAGFAAAVWNVVHVQGGAGDE